jgi:hypothetical protein
MPLCGYQIAEHVNQDVNKLYLTERNIRKRGCKARKADVVKRVPSTASKRGIVIPNVVRNQVVREEAVLEYCSGLAI